MGRDLGTRAADYGLIMLALVLVAVSVGSSNLAAAIGVGAGGVTMATRLRVLLVYGLLEAATPVIGLALGATAAARVGAEARWLAMVLLVAIGGYTVFEVLRDQDRPRDPAPRPGAGHPGAGHPGAAPDGGAGGGTSWPRLVLSATALSLDNVVAGFALGAYHVGVLVGALTFGLVSVLMSLAGLEFGARLGKRAGQRGELIGGVVLIAVGAAIGLGALS